MVKRGPRAGSHRDLSCLKKASGIVEMDLEGEGQAQRGSEARSWVREDGRDPPALMKASALQGGRPAAGGRGRALQPGPLEKRLLSE